MHKHNNLDHVEGGLGEKQRINPGKKSGDQHVISCKEILIEMICRGLLLRREICIQYDKDIKRYCRSSLPRYFGSGCVFMEVN